MAKATKPLGGGAKDRYLRELIGSAGLDADTAKHLTETAKREIAQVRVRLPLPERAKTEKGRRVTGAAHSSPPDAGGSAGHAAPPAATPDAAAFDPFAFSATVVLKRKGKAELARLLAAVSEPEHLKLIAEKQHLGLPAGVDTADALREAIISAAEARIDERRAAAS